MKTRADLTPYQEAGAAYITEHYTTLLRCTMGAGKTVMALTGARDSLDQHLVRRWLIIAPPNAAKTTWIDEPGEWEHLQDMIIHSLHGDASERRALLRQKGSYYVISMNLLPWLAREPEDLRRFDGVIIDETTKLKSFGAHWKAARDITRTVDTVVGLTGTLLSEGIEEIWPQMYLLDKGRHLGKTYQGFMSRHFLRNRYSQKWEPVPGTETLIAEALAPCTYMVPFEEYERHLPKVHVEYPTVVPNAALGTAMETMRDTVRTALDLIPEDHPDPRQAANAIRMRGTEIMRQLSSGFVYPRELYAGKGTPPPIWFDDVKARNIKADIDQMGDGQQHIIVYRYDAERALLKKLFPDSETLTRTGGKSTRAREIIRRWNARELPILLLHPESAAHGLNLQRGGNSIYFYSAPWSLDGWQQLIARLRRPGQEAENIFCCVPIMAGGSDMVVQGKLDVKNQRQVSFTMKLQKALWGQ